MASAQEVSEQVMTESRGLTVSVEVAFGLVVESGLYIEFESSTGKVSVSLRDNGEPPDTMADDSRYSGGVSLYEGSFHSTLFDGMGDVIWEDENQSIPPDFEMPALRIVISKTGTEATFVDDIDFVQEWELELGLDLEQVVVGDVYWIMCIG